MLLHNLQHFVFVVLVDPVRLRFSCDGGGLNWGGYGLGVPSLFLDLLGASGPRLGLLSRLVTKPEALLHPLLVLVRVVGTQHHLITAKKEENIGNSWENLTKWSITEICKYTIF